MPQPAVSPPPPLTRWGHTWRTLLVLLLSGIAWFAAVVTLDNGPGVGSELSWAWLLAVDPAIGLVALLLASRSRRTHPVGIAVATAVCSSVSACAAGPATLALCSVSTRRRVRELAVVAPLSLVGALVFELLYPEQDPLPFWAVFLVASLAVAVTVAVGFSVGARRELMASLRERAETSEREQQARISAAREAERTRIAREMHDVLAHRISLVSMHAAALSFRDDLPREQQAQVARTIQENAHLALQDLRDVLGVLRAPTEGGRTDGAPEGPQPDLAALARLVAEATSAGVRVELVDRTAGDAPTTTGRTAYRVVQEGLTNARKHAPGARVTVTLLGEPGSGLVVRVANRAPVTRPAGGVPGSGLGLLGLRERVDLAGGTLAHGWEGEEFVVRASLPWAA